MNQDTWGNIYSVIALTYQDRNGGQSLADTEPGSDVIHPAIVAS